MTNDEPTRREFEGLKARVRALEADQEERDVSPSDGLDSRDAAVLDALDHGESYTGMRIKHFYKKHTDIRREDTAKERAKTLTKKDCFQRDGRQYVYRGE